MKYTKVLICIICIIGIASCTTITMGDFSYMSTKDVTAKYKKNPVTGEVDVEVNTKSTGKRELMQGFIEALK